MECELLRSPMISYRSLLYNTTVLYDNYACAILRVYVIANKFCENNEDTYRHNKRILGTKIANTVEYVK